MATRSYTRNGVDSLGRSYTSEHYNNSSISNMVNGRVQLWRQSPHDFNHNWITKKNFWPDPNSGWYLPFADATNRAPPQEAIDFSQLTNEALAKFNGKLRKGSISLGMDIASYAQSRSMITRRLNALGNVLDQTARTLSADKIRRRRLKRQKDLLADDVLEYEFGWKPLIEDVHGALSTVCGQAFPPEFVTSRAKGIIAYSATGGSNPTVRSVYSGQGMVTLTASVRIQNPNLWLLNRLGLINPASVLWDAIPWSFVVNMFSNVNQLINSVTDWVGLDISGMSTTTSYSYIRDETQFYPSVSNAFTITETSVLRKFRTRQIGSFPPATLDFHLPKANWELAVIASSLVVQRFKKVNRLLGF